MGEVLTGLDDCCNAAHTDVPDLNHLPENM